MCLTPSAPYLTPVATPSRPYLSRTRAQMPAPPAHVPSSPRALVVCPYTQYSILDTHASSVQPSLWASEPLACIAVSLAHVSTCQHAPLRLRRAHFCTFAQELRSDLHFCTVSLPASDPHLAELGFEVGDGCGVGARFLPQFLQDDLEINGRLGEVSRPHGDIAGQRRAAIGPR